MSNPGDFAHEVKHQADIVRIIGDYVTLKKAGTQNFSGLCPFHEEKSPSFSVHVTRQFYHCFGCGVSGDVFSFVQKIENISFPEAVRAVALKLGITPPKQQFSPGEASEARERTAVMEMHERTCKFFEENLRKPEGARARQYLNERGITDDVIHQFRIGYSPDSGFQLRDHLKAGYAEDLLRTSGLFSWKEGSAPAASEAGAAAMYSKFRNRIMFPIFSEAGRVIAFGGRTLETGERAGPKYLNSPETPIYSKGRVLYNMDKAREAIRKLGYAILVEGYFDCISVYTAGFHNVIASSGTAFSEPQVKLLGRFSKKIVVNFDPDNAGAKAAERSLAMLVSEDFEIRVITLQAGLDPDLFLRKNGKSAYEKELLSAPNYFAYLIERTRAHFPVRTTEGKVQALNFLLPYVQKLPSRVARDEVAAEMSQKLGIDSAVLRQEIRHAATTRTATLKPANDPTITQAERIVVQALATPLTGTSKHDLDPRRQMQIKLRAEPLYEGLPTESLMLALLEAEDDSDSWDPMTLPLSDADRTHLARILMESEELTTGLLHESIEALRRGHLERKRRDLKFRISEAERKNDKAGLELLLIEKQAVDKSLSSL